MIFCKWIYIHRNKKLIRLFQIGCRATNLFSFFKWVWLPFPAIPKVLWNNGLGILQGRFKGSSVFATCQVYIEAINWCSLFKWVWSGTLKVFCLVYWFVYFSLWLCWQKYLNIFVAGLTTENIFYWLFVKWEIPQALIPPDIHVAPQFLRFS